MIRSLNITYLDSTHGADIIIQVEATSRALTVQAYAHPDASIPLVEVRVDNEWGSDFTVEANAYSTRDVTPRGALQHAAAWAWAADMMERYTAEGEACIAKALKLQHLHRKALLADLNATVVNDPDMV